MTQGSRSQKSSILYLDFSSFALSCLISEVNTEIAESPVMIRLSAIPPYPPVSCKLFELGGGIQKPWRRRNSLPPGMWSPHGIQKNNHTERSGYFYANNG